MSRESSPKLILRLMNADAISGRQSDLARRDVSSQCRSAQARVDIEMTSFQVYHSVNTQTGEVTMFGLTL